MRTHTITHKVPEKDFIEFRINFYKGMFPHLRFGQAFMNHFVVMQPDPTLFYEVDNEKAENDIRMHYILTES